MDNIKETTYGYEICWATTENYSGKILIFNRPIKTDLAFHKERQKSWFINSGDFRIRWIDTADGKLYDGSIAEVSTPEKDNDTCCVIPSQNIGD
jgi:hypothetical protein